MNARSIGWPRRLLLVCLALAAWLPIADAAETPAPGTAEATISRLSDREVRDLLIKQLSAADAQSGEAGESFNPAVFMYRLQRDAGDLSNQLHGIFSTIPDLPQVLPRAWRSFTADRAQGSVAWFFMAIIAAMGTGAAAAFLLRTRLRRTLAGLDQRQAPGPRRKAAILGTILLMDFACVAVFAAVAAAVFVTFFDVGSKDRIAFFFYLAASVIFASAIALSSAFFAPRRPKLRLPHFNDTDAASLHRATLITVGFGAFAYFTCALSGTLGVVGEVHELFLISVGSTTTALLIFTIISSRRAIAGDIAAECGDNRLRDAFASLWPWVFATVVAFIWVSLVANELLSDFVPYGAALFSIGLMAVAPSVDALCFREGLKYNQAGDEIKHALVRGTRIAVTVMVVIFLSVAWRLNPFAMGAEGSIGTKVAASLLQVSLTLLVAYVTWQFVRIFIDKKIAEEDALLAAQGIDLMDTEAGGTGLSRIRTLLPLLRRTLQICLSVIVIMIVLAALGVNIAPLLAGAGVVGLAIGFGSQSLVRDIVSGAFFLIDDAFRIGEYIDVGSVQGVVEKMSVRSLRLRHHRGAVHTVPFGEVKTLTNHSRDWAIMKLKFRVPFDTKIDKVRKLLKAVGLELAENEDIKDDFIQPFKSQGATEVDDYGFVITTKFTSKPGKQFLIRRYAFAAVQKAFEENGIEFAMPKIEVTLDPDGATRGDTATAKGPATAARRESAAGGAAGHIAQIESVAP